MNTKQHIEQKRKANCRTPFYTAFAKGKIGKEGKGEKEHNTRDVLQGHTGLTTNIDSSDTSIRKAVKIVEIIDGMIFHKQTEASVMYYIHGKNKHTNPISVLYDLG